MLGKRTRRCLRTDSTVERRYFLDGDSEYTIARDERLPLRYVYSVLEACCGSPNYEEARKCCAQDIMVFEPGHPRSRSGYVDACVVAAEAKLGRPLRHNETVRHRNGIAIDARPENLEVVVVDRSDIVRAAAKVAVEAEFNGGSVGVDDVCREAGIEPKDLLRMFSSLQEVLYLAQFETEPIHLPSLFDRMSMQLKKQMKKLK